MEAFSSFKFRLASNNGGSGSLFGLDGDTGKLLAKLLVTR